MEKELIGLWSADHMYGPGAQSDEILVFKADGTGRLEIINWALCSVDFFNWKITSSNRLDLIGSRRLVPDQAVKNFIEIPSEFTYCNLIYQIQEEDTKSGLRMPVLRLFLYQGISDHYGLVRKDLTGFEEPYLDLKQ